MKNYAKRFLLVGGIGHTDLSGKVPRPGLLMLRRALRNAGHDADVLNFAASFEAEQFPKETVARLSKIYRRTIKPIVVDGVSPLQNPWSYLRLPSDMRRLVGINSKLQFDEPHLMARLGRALSKTIQAEQYDAVGFSLYMGSSTTGAIIIADILRKEHPMLPIFFGGPQTSHFGEAIYRETSAPTALVQGEGEIAIVGLAESLSEIRNGKQSCLYNIPNLIFREPDGTLTATDRERMSHPEWVSTSADIYCAEDFSGILKYAFIEASRGCKYSCRFCPQPLLSGKERYLKSGERIVDEMVSISQQFGITHFELVGSSTPPSQAEEIAEALVRRNLDSRFKWVLFMRGKDDRDQRISPVDLMKNLKRSGVCAIFFGVEAASDHTLIQMGKGESIADIKTSMMAAKQAGIAVIGSFIYPYPNMLPDEGQQILSFLESVRPVSAPTQPLGLYPGTYCAENAAELGVEVLYPSRKDHLEFLKGKKPAPSMNSPEVQQHLLRYPLILSLPMRFWPSLPWKINGIDFKQTVKLVNTLQKKIAKLNIQTGLSHSHILIGEVLGWTPAELSERLFYCSISGDPLEINRIISLFNAEVIKNAVQFGLSEEKKPTSIQDTDDHVGPLSVS